VSPTACAAWPSSRPDERPRSSPLVRRLRVPARARWQLVGLVAEQGDADELRRLADAGNSDDDGLLIEPATGRENLDELRRLAGAGNRTAAEQLSEPTGE
jgi:hypothetical protein